MPDSPQATSTARRTAAPRRSTRLGDEHRVATPRVIEIRRGSAHGTLVDVADAARRDRG